MTTVRPLGRRGPSLLPMAKAVAEEAAVLSKAEPVSYRRPFVVGYVDAGKLRRDANGQVQQDAVDTARSQIADYAAEHELDLGNTYVDFPTAGRSQFRTLLIAVAAWNPQLVLVPSLDHVDPTADVSRHNAPG